MTIQPTKRILATTPYPQNPFGIQVYVADEEARNAVNALSGSAWVLETSFLSDNGEIIKAGKFDGFFKANPCFELAGVIATIESALEAEQYQKDLDAHEDRLESEGRAMNEYGNDLDEGNL